jgi:hypothetical protein
MMANQTRARRSEPNAILPKLYLNIQCNPLSRDAFPLVSDVEVKYHTHAATITINYVQDMIMARIHRRPKKR